MMKCKVVVEEQGAQEPKLRRKHLINKKAMKSWRRFVNWIMTDAYMNHEDDFSLQQVSIVSHVGVPFHSMWASEFQLEDYKYQMRKIS